MTAINAASSTPVYTPVPDQAAVTTEKSSIRQIQQHALGSTLAKMLDGTSADLPLPAPDADALTPGNVKAAAAHFSSLAPQEVSIDISSIMALFQKIAQEARNGARIHRETLAQAEVKSMLAEAQDMRDSASATFKGAVIQGAMQIAGGVAQVGMSAASARQSIKGINQEATGRAQLTEANQGAKNGMSIADQKSTRIAGLAAMKDGKLLSTSATTYNGYSQASGGIATGIGGIAGAVHAKEAADSDARRAEQAAVTKVAETGVQQANESMQAMLDVIKDTRDKLQSMQQSSTETNRTINRNI